MRASFPSLASVVQRWLRGHRRRRPELPNHLPAGYHVALDEDGRTVALLRPLTAEEAREGPADSEPRTRHTWLKDGQQPGRRGYRIPPDTRW